MAIDSCNHEEATGYCCMDSVVITFYFKLLSTAKSHQVTQKSRVCVSVLWPTKKLIFVISFGKELGHLPGNMAKSRVQLSVFWDELYASDQTTEGNFRMCQIVSQKRGQFEKVRFRSVRRRD